MGRSPTHSEPTDRINLLLTQSTKRNLKKLATLAGLSVSQLLSNWVTERADPSVICVKLSNEEAVKVSVQATSRGLRPSELLRIAVVHIANQPDPTQRG